jgi:hypothetical protein
MGGVLSRRQENEIAQPDSPMIRAVVSRSWGEVATIEDDGEEGQPRKGNSFK